MSGGLCVLIFVGMIALEIGWVFHDIKGLLVGISFLVLTIWASMYVTYQEKCRVHQANVDMPSLLLLEPCTCILPNGTKLRPN